MPDRTSRSGPAIEARIAGLVLAGGRSRRFGADKAAALLAGRPLLAWALAALEGACEAVAVSGKSGGAAATLALALGRPLLSDDPNQGAGPLAGVAAGFAWAAAAGFDILVTLPCDTPAVEPVHLQALLAALGGAPAAYAVSPEGPHPLCAAWRTSLAADLAGALAEGDHPPVRSFLTAIGAAAVTFEDSRPFANINRPEDLRRHASALP